MSGSGDTAQTSAFSDKEIAVLAAHLNASRPALSRTYAEVVRMTGGRLTDFKILALGMQDTKDAFRAALAETMTVHADRSFLGELANQKLIDLDAAMSKIASLRDTGDRSDMLLWLQDSSGAQIVPEAWDATIARTLDMAKVMDAVHRAARRVCMVKAGDTKQGTGFLIGPHTVLTNWHVVAALIDPATGSARDGSANDLSFHFENLRDDRQSHIHDAVADWLVDFSPLDLVNAALVDAALDMTALRPHALDYCAIRVAGAPGRERGWYDLTRTGSLDRETDHTLVFQHPKNFPQRLGIATGAKPDPNDNDFILHNAWTDGGSSGALCMDHQFKPLALHHAGVTGDDGVFRYNRAVRLSAIHAANPQLGAADARFDRISQVNVPAEDGRVRVIIGRGETQDKIQEMMHTPDRPLLYVQGEERSGKSFTKYLIRDCIPFDRRNVVILSAAELPADPRELAKLILKRAGIPNDAISALPPPDTANGTDNAWIQNRLLPAIRTALTSHMRVDPDNPGVLWLIIDELEFMPVPQTAARELLDRIYADADTMQVLRIVLIGLNAPLQGVDPRLTDTLILDDPEDITDDTVEACLGALMQTRDVAAAPGELKRQAQLATGMAKFLRKTEGNKNDLERTSDVLASVWLKTARKWQ